VGVISPFEVLVQNGDPAAVARQLARVGNVRGAIAPIGPAWRRGSSALVDVFPNADASSAAGRDIVTHIRAAALGGAGHVRVGGPGPLVADFISAVYGSFPLMILLIAVITFVLLVRAFRSLLLPLKAVILNILSVAAAWGVLVIVWQYGYGSQAIWGIQSTGAITFWIPLMVFAFLFGLSMDYEVFILSRVREEYDKSGSTNAAVVTGIGRTGPAGDKRGAHSVLRFSRSNVVARDRHQGDGHWPGCGNFAGRHGRPHAAGTRPGVALRPVELVAPDPPRARIAGAAVIASFRDGDRNNVREEGRQRHELGSQ